MEDRIEVMNPSGKVKRVPQGIAGRLAGLEGRVLGVLDNSKDNADLLLRAVVEELKSRYGISEALWFRKHNSGVAAPEQLLDACAARSAAVVTATGD